MLIQKLCDQPVDEGKLGSLLDNYSKNIEEDEENPFIVSLVVILIQHYIICKNIELTNLINQL